MYPGKYASINPDALAAILYETGEQLTYGQLELRSRRLAAGLRAAGLGRGDVVALVTENNLRAFEVYWAALRSGLYVTAINHHLSPDEVHYIVEDSGAAALITSNGKGELAATVARRTSVGVLLAYDGEVDGFASYEEFLEAAPDDEPSRPAGATMLYSSGTTGRPKGVRATLPDRTVDDGADALAIMVGGLFSVSGDSIYLSPSPIYHTAPLRWCGAVQSYGGTVVMMRKFTAEHALEAIERYRVTHAQFVPTMFVRMLQLPEARRAAYNVSSLRVAVHSAAPCPVEVKQQMIDWWGPILAEYYGATEGNGITMIDSAAWAAKPGSVGRSVLGVVHICDSSGADLPLGQVGAVYFERDEIPFVYHNDPDKTKDSQHPQHETWTTLGDLGYLDEDGYLFLTDRAAFTIISGGVNIYPQEIENALALHPAIFDVAVIGLPDADLGEAVTAFVQPAPGATPGPELAEEIIAFTKSKIASFKAPRAVHFVDQLPRSEAGKLVKGELKKQFADGSSQAGAPSR